MEAGCPLALPFYLKFWSDHKFDHVVHEFLFSDLGCFAVAGLSQITIFVVNFRQSVDIDTVNMVLVSCSIQIVLVVK